MEAGVHTNVKGSVVKSTVFILILSLWRKMHNPASLVPLHTTVSYSVYSQWDLRDTKSFYILSFSALPKLHHTSPYPNTVLSSFLILARLNYSASYTKDKWGHQPGIPLSSCCHFLPSKYSHCNSSAFPRKCTIQISWRASITADDSAAVLWGLSLHSFWGHGFSRATPSSDWAWKGCWQAQSWRHGTSSAVDLGTHGPGQNFLGPGLQLRCFLPNPAFVPFLHSCRPPPRSEGSLHFLLLPPHLSPIKLLHIWSHLDAYFLENPN